MNSHHDTGTPVRANARASDALWDWNLHTHRIHFSPGWLAMIGCQPQELGTAPESWFTRVHPDDSDALRRELEAIRTGSGSEFALRYRLRHHDNTYRWMTSKGLVVRNDAGEAVRLTGTQRDATAETVTDPVTGLPNQLLLFDRVTQSLERARRHTGFHFALLLVDIGRPTSVERPVTRVSADPLLNAAARRLETYLGRADGAAAGPHKHLVARLEGDLLAVLLDGLDDVTTVERVAECIVDTMLEPILLSGREIRLSASLGITVSATSYARAEDVVRDARTALHRAQVLGGAHYAVFDRETLQSSHTSQQIEADLEAALQRGEFVVLYQPIVSMETRRVLGFEALVRWQHPALGVVPPSDFIALAERTGFIVPLGAWILEQACQRLAAWRADLPGAQDLWMSVNLSGVQLRHPALVEQVTRTLRDSSLPGQSLAVELTEGVAMENPAGVTTVLMQLRAMGIRVSIDDFGTGYSSLAYLRQFPVDTLKIDRAFVSGLDRDTDAVAIVEGVTSMAERLGLHVIAEGVEQESQWSRLRSLRCHAAQGYLVARPLSAEDAALWIESPGWPADEPSEDGRSALPATAGREAAGTRKHRLLVSALLTSAVLVVVMTAGIGSIYSNTREPGRAVSSSGMALDGQRSATVHHAVPTTAAASAAPAPAGREAVRSGDTLNAANVTKSNPDAARTVPPASKPLAQLGQAGVPVSVGAEAPVVHRHKLGSCRGVLRVTGDRLTFAPEDTRSDDVFDLPLSALRFETKGTTLTVKTEGRTYRFADMAAIHDHAASLAQIADALQRAGVVTAE